MATAQIISPDEVEKLIDPVVRQATALTVCGPDDYEMACAFLQLVATRRKQVDETFDPIVRKAHETHKEAVAQKKRFTDPLASAEQTVKMKVSTWRIDEDRKRRLHEAELAKEAQRQRDEEALAQADQLAQGGQKEMAEMVLQDAAEAPAPVVVLPSSMPKVEGVSSRKNWKFRVVNEGLIPREYLSPDPIKIGAVVRSQKDMAKISGVEVYCDESVAVRAR